jgi:hypothetical protein
MALKPQNECFSALSEPSVRFGFNELRFGNELTRKRSLVRIQSRRDTDSMLKTQCGEWRGNELSAVLTVVHSYYISEPSEHNCTLQFGSGVYSFHER